MTIILCTCKNNVFSCSRCLHDKKHFACAFRINFIAIIIIIIVIVVVIIVIVVVFAIIIIIVVVIAISEPSRVFSTSLSCSRLLRGTNTVTDGIRNGHLLMTLATMMYAPLPVSEVMTNTCTCSMCVSICTVSIMYGIQCCIVSNSW